MPLGANARYHSCVRVGYRMARRWRYANSLYRVLFFYLFLAHVLYVVIHFFFSFLFVLILLSCSRWSFVDVPMIFSCPADHVQYRIIGNYVLLLLLLFLTFSVLVANPKKLLYTVANPARGLLNREKRTKEKVWQHTPPPHPPHCSFGENK